MTIKIYNSLTQKKEDFRPLESGKVNMYVCGVTVYDECHIGHARSLFMFEVIRRYFKYRGYEVRFIRNITDIDDKIIKRAVELGVLPNDLARKYISEYYHDLDSLGIDRADVEPKATDHIEDIIGAVAGLVDKGYAYFLGSDVYFSVDKFKDYGRLSNQKLDRVRAGARIDKDEKKKNPLDFVLWKGAKKDEPSWPSPWGAGRPGWHIECSTMSTKYLGKTFDIHGGGRDLIFPHHENEIAQAESLNAATFANYWLHHGLLTIDGQKMAKSLGNSLTIKQLISKYDANTLKLFFLSNHYSSPINFTDDRMREWDRARKKIDIFYDRLSSTGSSGDFPDTQESLGPVLKNVRTQLKKIRLNFEEAMDDNFNTAGALAVLFGFLDYTSEFMNFNQEDRRLAFYFSGFLFGELCYCLGISVKKKAAKIADEEIMKKINERIKARGSGDFKKADKIRDELEAGGIILEDTKDKKTIYRRK